MERIHGLCETKDVSDWENKFIKSCWNFSKEGAVTSFLTSKQIEIVERIFNKHFS